MRTSAKKWWPWILKANSIFQLNEDFPKHKTISYFGGYLSCSDAGLLSRMCELQSRQVSMQEEALVGTLCYIVIGYKEEIKPRADTVILGLPLRDLTSEWLIWILTFMFPWPRIFFTFLDLIVQLQHVGFDEFMNLYLMLISLSQVEKTCHIWYKNAARPCWMSCLRLSFSQLTHWKKGMGGTGSSWQQCLKLKAVTKELPLGLLWGPPVQQEWGAQAGIGASCRGVGLLRQFSLAWSQPHAVSFCSI